MQKNLTPRSSESASLPAPRISRRGFISIGGAAATVTALSVDELAWADDGHDELLTLIKSYGEARKYERECGDALDELNEDPALPVVGVRFSEIRPSIGLNGRTYLFSEAEIVQLFDAEVKQRRSWAPDDHPGFEMLAKAREFTLSLFHERERFYDHWRATVAYQMHEQRFEAAAEESDRIFGCIVKYPCRCLRDAAAKAQFVIDQHRQFDMRTDELLELLATIAAQGREV
jgi:hypothetical protein